MKFDHLSKAECQEAIGRLIVRLLIPASFFSGKEPFLLAAPPRVTFLLLLPIALVVLGCFTSFTAAIAAVEAGISGSQHHHAAPSFEAVTIALCVSCAMLGAGRISIDEALSHRNRVRQLRID